VRRLLAAVTETERLGEAEPRLPAHRLLRRAKSVRDRLAVLDRHLRALASHRSGRLAAGDSTALCWFAPSPRRATPASACGVDDTPPGLPDLGWRPHLTGPLRTLGDHAHHYSVLRAPALPAVAAAIDRNLHTVLSHQH
jgi:hypothetical protein